ncbi:MAG: ABC transporter substrate-binding protein [Acidimicrobiia bacterium]|nr:ABC transporter substrate-binding protein [Acidimicrobiia bacterium]
MKRGMKVLALLMVLALFAAACGDDDGGDTTAAPTQAPTTQAPATTAGGGDGGTTETTAAPMTGVSCDEPVTVGVITDQTGALAIYGSHVNRGVPLGFAYATGSDAPGDGLSVAEQTYMLDDCEIRVVFKDDQSNAELSATAARELIEIEGAEIIIGSVSSGVTATLQGIARENDVILIAAPAAATDLTGKDFDPNTFRASRSNYQDGMAICDQFVNGDGYETFVQIAPDYSFGYGGAQAYKDACEFFGGEFIADDVFAPADTTDFTSFLQPFADSDADAFLVTWAGGGFVPLLQAAIDLGVVDDDTVLGSPFVDNVVMPAFFGNAVGTTSVILYHYGAPSNPVNDYLIANMATVGGTNPDLFDADGMNAAIMVVEALRASGGAADADSLRAALEGLSFEGPKGLIEIRAEDHMAIQDMYVVTLTGFDDAGPLYDNVATVRPVPPCLLEGDFTSRCGDLPVGSLGG